MPAVDALDPRSRRTLLELLACMAAADGEISDEERTALRGAEVALGAEKGAWPSVPALEEIPVGHLDARGRTSAFAAAAWMRLADGLLARGEHELLERLRARLGLPEDTARFLERLAQWVRTSTGDRAPHRELDLLLTEAARRLALVERRRRTAA